MRGREGGGGAAFFFHGLAIALWIVTVAGRSDLPLRGAEGVERCRRLGSDNRQHGEV